MVIAKAVGGLHCNVQVDKPRSDIICHQVRRQEVHPKCGNPQCHASSAQYRRDLEPLGQRHGEAPCQYDGDDEDDGIGHNR